MFIVIIAMSITLFLAIGWVTPRDDQNGLRPLTYALGLHAVGYILLALRGAIPDFLSIWCANVIVTSAIALLIYAISIAQRRRIPRGVLWGPIVVVGVGFALFFDNLTARFLIGGSVLVVQEILLLAYLITGRQRIVGRSQYLLIAGTSLTLFALLFRDAVLLLGIEQISSFQQASPSQTLVYLSAFISLNLVSIGFVLMSKEQADEQMRLMAMKDRLTGCWNRAGIENDAQREMLRLHRYNTPVSLLLLDIDHFKAINDTHGHSRGDEVLKRFAERVEGLIRETDRLGRWGGEEFVVLLPSTGFTDAIELGERIRRDIAQHLRIEDQPVTVSIGVASCVSNERWADWLDRADVALYRAKELGRNRVEGDVPRSSSSYDTSQPGVLHLQWSADYLLGHAALDADHKQLFDCANALLNAVLHHAPHAEQEGYLLDFLTHMKQHMSREEEILRAIDAPAAETHAALHRNLVERATWLTERFLASRLDVQDLLHFVIYEFTIQHLLIEDQRFAPYLPKHTAKPD